MRRTLSEWRLDQIAYNEKALEWLAQAAGARFWGWEIVVMFYGIVIALDGYAAAKGHPAPKSHRERRAVVRLHLPHLVNPYDTLYSLSLNARYHRGYAMTEKSWSEAARCREALGSGIPMR